MNEGNPDHQIVLPRTTLSLASQNHGREKRHVARGNPLEDRKRDSKSYGLAIGNGGETTLGGAVTSVLNTHSSHPDPIDVDVTLGQGDEGHSSSQSTRNSGRWDVHLSMGMDD